MWMNVIIKDMDASGLNKDISLDRNEQRKLIYVIDPA